MNYLSYGILILILAIAAFWDVRTKSIPDSLIIIALAAGCVTVFLNPYITIFDAFTGFVLAGGVLWFVKFVTKGAIGICDVKLVACTGIFLGFDMVLSVLMTSAILCGLAGLVVVLTRRSNLKSTISFVPFLLVGVIITLVI